MHDGLVQVLDDAVVRAVDMDADLGHGPGGAYVEAGVNPARARRPRSHVAKIGRWGLHHVTSLGSLADGLRCA